MCEQCHFVKAGHTHTHMIRYISNIMSLHDMIYMYCDNSNFHCFTLHRLCYNCGTPYLLSQFVSHDIHELIVSILSTQLKQKFTVSKIIVLWYDMHTKLSALQTTLSIHYKDQCFTFYNAVHKSTGDLINEVTGKWSLSYIFTNSPTRTHTLVDTGVYMPRRGFQYCTYHNYIGT